VIAQLQNFTMLHLGANQIQEIPTTIAQLQNLTRLYLWGNQIQEIPVAITQLQNLTKLFLNRNKIEEIPIEIAQLSNLKGLYLGENQIREIPETIAQLSNLTDLNLNYNQIREIPEAIAQLQNLTKLFLGGNQIKEISEAIAQLSKLTMLILSSNQIKEIPVAIQNLSKLEELDLRGNPISIPSNILAPDNEEHWPKARPILDYYFRTQDPNETTHIYEVKILIVGEGGSGKTSLAQKLLDPDYELPAETQDTSTEGIDILRWEFTGRNNQNYRVNIWDFGGQEMYHQTHQFFLTERSLYLLVADSRKEDTDHYFWLQIIRLLSDASPVLLIQNEKQNRTCNLNLRELRAEFENLQPSLSTNLADNRGLAEVKTTIERHLEDLLPNGIPFPNPWLKVRYTLENDGRNYIECNEYEATCRAHGITDRTEMYNLSRFLHSLGVCLHFQKDAILRHRLILKPNWGTAAVYKILDNKKVKTELGQFSDADLHNIWHESEYADMHHELLQLMKEFKVCYEIPRRQGNYIAPHLLSSDQPEYDWNPEQNLILRYKYKTFMPKGILTRFIVEMHQYIENVSEPNKALVWKNGVVLVKNNVRAEIIERHQTREIQIRLSGVNQRDFLAAINYEFEKIHHPYKDDKQSTKLDYDTLIPCNCDTCKTLSNPYTYTLNRLRDYLAKKRYTIECYESGENVNVRRLLDDSIHSTFIGRADVLTELIVALDQDPALRSRMKTHQSITGGTRMAPEPKNNLDLRGANIANLVVEAKDYSQVTAKDFTQNSVASTADLLKIIGSMRQNISAFPTESQGDLVDDIDVIEAELSAPEEQRDQNKIVRKLKRIATTAVAAFALVAAPTAGMIDFANNITDLAAKVEPAQVQVIQEIIHKALPISH
jgi:Leucine-rich repeat (LRR) protein